jgi:hypothetical protein
MGRNGIARECLEEVGCSLTTLDQLRWHVGVQPEEEKPMGVLKSLRSSDEKSR